MLDPLNHPGDQEGAHFDNGAVTAPKGFKAAFKQFADAGWIGEAGPGPSYLDPGSGGPDNDFTNRNTTFMTWNLLHIPRLLKDAGGFPAHGNQRSLWDAGERFGFEKAEYR